MVRCACGGRVTGVVPPATLRPRHPSPSSRRTWDDIGGHLTRRGAWFVAIPRQLAEGLDSRLVDTVPELLDRVFGGGLGAAGIAVVEMGGPLAADVDVFHLVGPVEVLELRHQRVVGLVAAEFELASLAGAPHG